MTTSDSIKNIATALIAFQKEVAPIKKEETNPFFKSKYADLTAVLNGIKEPLEKAGLAFAQFPDEDGLTTILMHAESGEFLQAKYKLVLAKQDPQGQGSALTYSKRYALCAILGLATEDDDGNGSISQANTLPGVPAVVSSLRATGTATSNLGKCADCTSNLIPGKNGKPYCKPCYVKWAKMNKPQPTQEQIPDFSNDPF